MSIKVCVCGGGGCQPFINSGLSFGFYAFFWQNFLFWIIYKRGAQESS